MSHTKDATDGSLVERVAQAIHDSRCGCGELTSASRERWIDFARAALVPVRQAALDVAEKWKAHVSGECTGTNCGGCTLARCADELSSLFPEEGETR